MSVLSDPCQTISKFREMTNFKHPLQDIARFCALGGLILLNGLAYYAPTRMPLDNNLLLFNISAGLYLAFIYPLATNAR